MRRYIIYYTVLVALMLTFAIYTAMHFPYTYMTLEGDNYWVLTRDFWHLKLATPPALTTWLADFLMQYYSSPFIAAGIEALALGLIGLLARRWLSWLALLPPVILGFFCTFSLTFMLQWLFFFLMLNAFATTGLKGRLAWSLLCVPIGFFLMRTPLLALLIISQAALACKAFGIKKCTIWLMPLALVGVAPLVYSQQIAFIPFEERYTAFGTYFDALTSRYNRDGEYVKKLVCLSNEGRWEDLLYKEHVKGDARRGNSAALRYALLAESALGTLPDNFLDYPIREENQFFYPHQTEYVASQFNRLFYLNLCIYDEAYHHAQEYGQLQPNGICFSSLRQMVDYSIEEGDYEISEKFIEILSKSSCHKSFIESRRQKMSACKSSDQQKKPVSLRADNFVGGFPLPIEMLRLARYYGDCPQQKKMVDYAICCYMLRGDAERFVIATRAFDIYKDKPLPKAYREFWERYVSTASTASSVSNPLDRR
ncbi:MAG: hypothetical protein J6I86_01390 [Bacteroidaceae bacterium]|nr:hypothetical protein [Bacteroidaceae bacterium]